MKKFNIGLKNKDEMKNHTFLNIIVWHKLRKSFVLTENIEKQTMPIKTDIFLFY